MDADGKLLTVRCRHLPCCFSSAFMCTYKRRYIYGVITMLCILNMFFLMILHELEMFLCIEKKRILLVVGWKLQHKKFVHRSVFVKLFVIWWFLQVLDCSSIKFDTEIFIRVFKRPKWLKNVLKIIKRPNFTEFIKNDQILIFKIFLIFLKRLILNQKKFIRPYSIQKCF